MLPRAGQPTVRVLAYRLIGVSLRVRLRVVKVDEGQCRRATTLISEPDFGVSTVIGAADTAICDWEDGGPAG